MKIYKCHKTVIAKPMNRLDYNVYRGWQLSEDEDGADEGYLVEYTDGGNPNHPDHKGYISWSPKEQFDNGYTEQLESTPYNRLIKEAEELKEKTIKLNDFMKKGRPAFISSHDWGLMIDQQLCMQKYLIILDERIAIFTN